MHPSQREPKPKELFDHFHQGTTGSHEDDENPDAEDRRRRASAVAEAAEEAPFVPQPATPKKPEYHDPPTPKFIDRLHKWCRYYVFVSPNHNTADADPVPNPGYMTTGRTFSSIMDAYTFARDHLSLYLSNNEDRIGIFILGGRWEEDIALELGNPGIGGYAANRIDFYGDHGPVINGRLTISPAFDDVTFEGIRFIAPGGAPAACFIVPRLLPAPQRWPTIIFRHCVFESFFGTAFWSQRPVRCEDCIFAITRDTQSLPAFSAEPFAGGNATRKPVVRIEALTEQFGWSEFYRCWFYCPVLKAKFAIGSPTYAGTALQATAATAPRHWLGTQHPSEVRTLYQSGVRLYDCHMHGTTIVDHWKLYGHKTVFNGGTSAVIAAARIPIAAIGRSANVELPRIESDVELEHSTVVGAYCYTGSIGTPAQLQARNRWWVRKTDHLLHVGEAGALLASAIVPMPGMNGLAGGSAIDGSSPCPAWGGTIAEYGTTMNILGTDAEWYHSP